MKIQRMGLIAMIVGLFVIIGAITASADWYTCTVNMAGVNYSSPAIRLTDTAATPAFTNLWFRLAGPNNTSNNQMLATALTAMSNGKNVVINAQGITAFDDITGLYVAP